MESKAKKTDILKKLSMPKIVSLAVIGVIVLVFIAAQIYLAGTKKSIKTEIALADEIKTSLTVQMLAVRDEKVLSYGGENVVSAVKDGSRVSFSDIIAYSFADSTSAGNIVRMNEIEELIDYYTSLMNKSATVSGDTESYDNRIFTDLNDFSACVSDGNFTQINLQLSDIRDAITSKQTATGIKLDVSETLKSLNSEYESLKKATGSYTPIRSGGTGYYISGTDGCEAVLDYSGVDEWTVSDVENAFGFEPETIKSTDIGRLVHGYYWYLVCVMDTKDADKLTVGSRKTVCFPDTTVDDVTATVYDVRRDADSGKSVVILSCNAMNEDLAALRFVKAQIILSEYEGYRIDNRAIRVNENEKTGVYVVTGKIIRFREFELVYATDEYSIVKTPKEEDLSDGATGIKIYDEYIVDGIDLYDGKLID